MINPKVLATDWEEDFAYPGDTVNLKVNTFEMAEFNYNGILNFYDKKKISNMPPLFSQDISIDSDDKEIEIQIPLENLNMTYKDVSGFANLCAEFKLKDKDYSYIETNTLDILIDFERE